MAQLRHIANLRNDASATILEYLNSYVFGNNLPQFYNPNKTYNRGSLILNYNPTTKRFDILECIDDCVTDIYNPSDWQSNNVVDNITGKFANTKLIQVKTIQPDDLSNVVWFQQMKVKPSMDPSVIK